MNNYWIDRIKREEALTFTKSQHLLKDISMVYKEAYRDIKNSIDELELITIRNEQELNLLEINKLLSPEERNELDKSIKKTLKGYEELAKNIDYKNLKNVKEVYKFRTLQNLGYRSRITRLQAKQMEIEAILTNLSRQQELMLSKHLEEVYEDTYYKTAYINALQSGEFETISRLDSDTIVKAVKKSWVADGKNFSSRIWGNNSNIAQEISRHILSNIASGRGTRGLAHILEKQYKVALYQANRLIQTETSAIRNQATMDRYKDGGIDKYQIIAVLDSRTSNICQSMDKKVFKVKDKVIGINYPPFHINCRSTTIAYFEFLEGESSKSTSKEEKPLKMPKMSYKEWEKKYVNNDNYIQQEQAIKKNKTNNAYTVDYKFINSKKFHEKFETLKGSKNLRESLYKESMDILNVQNGTGFESIAILDYKTGKVLMKHHGNMELKARIPMNDINSKITVLHNHPGGGRFSYTDIKNYFKYENVETAVVISNSGEVHEIRNIDRRFNIDNFIEERYNEYKKIYPENLIAKKTLDDLYKEKVFEYEEKK